MECSGSGAARTDGAHLHQHCPLLPRVAAVTTQRGKLLRQLDELTAERLGALGVLGGLARERLLGGLVRPLPTAQPAPYQWPAARAK